MPEDRRFIGFDAYKKAMDCLSPGDIVILATPPAFRWVHFTYAIEKGLNVFMEKPVAVDAPSARRMFDLAKKAGDKNLKVGVGLMCRHCPARNELHDRIRNGEMAISCCCVRIEWPGQPVRRLSVAIAAATASCSTKFATSTRSSGPAAAGLAIFTSTTSTSAAG